MRWLPALCLSACLLHGSVAIILTVPAGADECVSERLVKDNKLTGSFEVLAGDEVGVVVYGPDGSAHYSTGRVKSGNLQVIAPTDGLYKLCLLNQPGRDAKTVAVRWGTGGGARAPPPPECALTPAPPNPPPPPSLYPPPPSLQLSIHAGDDLFQTIAKQEHITPLEQEITQLADGVSRIEDEQQYMWAREKQTSETNASTNARVLWFSVGEAVVLLGLGLWQVMMLRSFFERKGRA
jgi:hypothetical protein